MSDITQDRLDATWRSIEFELDAPRPSWLERGLRLVRVPDHVARLVVATPALRRSWFVALALVVVIGLVATDDTNPRSSIFVLLFLAPLAPVAGVALAYGRWADPAHELHVTTPMHGLRVLVIRTLTVLVVSITVIGGLALLGDLTRPYAAAWLLPALATTSATAALMTVLSPSRAALVATAGWTVLALIGRSGADDLSAFSPVAQLASVAMTGVAATMVWLRRDRLDVIGVAA